MSDNLRNLFGPTEPTDALVEDNLRQIEASLNRPTARGFIAANNFPNDGYPHGRYGMFRKNDGLISMVQRCLEALRPIDETYDALYVTGLSGTVPASILAYILKKELLILRKQTNSGLTLSHGDRLEGDSKFKEGVRYMIVDDFVSSGKTLTQLVKHLPNKSAIVGVLLYGHPRNEKEVEQGFLKIFNSNGGVMPWNLVRRGPDSMLFDIVPK